MKKLRILFIFILLTICSLPVINARQMPADSVGTPLEHQYEEYITTALRLQVKADSLARSANQKRRELAFLGDDTSKREMENQIISLERESFRAQKQADSLYSQARAVELRIVSGRGVSGESLSNLPESAQDRQVSGRQPGTQSLSDDVSPDFLTLGEENISSWLSPGEILAAKELEQDYARANSLIGEVSDINDEIEQLGQVLDGNPRRRERRNINHRIDELSEQSFEKHIAALQIYNKVNELRYRAASRFIEEKREKLSDPVVIKQGLAHEEIARESFRQAAGLRQTALDLRSDKYFEGFTLRAYTEELKAFNELEKALEIYDNPSLVIAEEEPEIPLQADGRIDPGLALSRARSAYTEPEQTSRPSPAIPVTQETILQDKAMDFEFSILRETPYSADNPIPENVSLPDGIVYSIQIGIFNTKMNPGSFGGLYPVMSERSTGNGSIRYFAGVLRTFPEAERALIDVNRQGFSDAFIVAYNNNSRIPVNRARQMDRSRHQAEIISSQRELLPYESKHAGSEQGAVIIKIQLGAFGSPVQPDVYLRWQNLAENKNIEQFINNNGLYVYSIGNFNTFDEAVRMRNVFRAQGVPDAFIVPYKDDIRISMEEANKLMKQ